jgi:hypothetical protein
MYRSLIIFVVAILAAPPMAAASTSIVGEIHRTTATPSAAVRDAQHRSELRITVWYPATDSAAARPIDIGILRSPLLRRQLITTIHLSP